MDGNVTTIGLGVLIGLIVIALAFDFMNGFHDAANSIATVVSTGVLRPHYAVAWAAFFNFVAIFIFHLKVAAMVGKGIMYDSGGINIKPREGMQLYMKMDMAGAAAVLGAADAPAYKALMLHAYEHAADYKVGPGN